MKTDPKTVPLRDVVEAALPGGWYIESICRAPSLPRDPRDAEPVGALLSDLWEVRLVDRGCRRVTVLARGGRDVPDHYVHEMRRVVRSAVERAEGALTPPR